MARRKPIPFKKIVDSIDLLDACTDLGIKLKKQGGSYRGECPGCDNKRMAVTPGEGFCCHKCDLQGDVIALTRAAKDFDGMYDAAAYLVETFNLDFERKQKSTVPEEKEKPADERGFQPLDYLKPDHEAVVALGFDPEDARALGVGFAPRGLHKNTVAVPVRTDDGVLRGYIGVTEAKLPKSWHL